MTEKEFFAELRKIDDWTVVDSKIRSTIRRSSPTCIPLANHGKICSLVQFDCPVCAVAHSLGTSKFRNARFPDAADYLGMDSELASEIADTSDIPYEWMKPNTRQSELRSKLLEATGTN